MSFARYGHAVACRRSLDTATPRARSDRSNADAVVVTVVVSLPELSGGVVRPGFYPSSTVGC